MQDISLSMGDLPHSNAKAKLDGGPIQTFTAFYKDSGDPVEVDPRTFDPVRMVKDKPVVPPVSAPSAPAAAPASDSSAPAQ